MEKATVGFGFVMFCLFFLIGFATYTDWLWGCIPSLAIIFFGWFFWED
jgi:hypothetical protein